MEIRTYVPLPRSTRYISRIDSEFFFFPSDPSQFSRESYVVLVDTNDSILSRQFKTVCQTRTRGLGGSLNSTRFARTFLFHVLSRVCVHESSESCAPRVSSPPFLSPLSFFSFFCFVFFSFHFASLFRSFVHNCARETDFYRLFRSIKRIA